jgi:glycosyltransferase involved in cell wall biosynthesis
MSKKPLKIIHLSMFLRDNPPNFPAVGSDDYYAPPWAGLIARRLAKRYPDLDTEVWRAEPKCDSVSERKVFGLKGVIFPYKHPIVKNTFTVEMFKRIRSYTKDYTVIVHYHALYDGFSILAPLLLKNVGLVYSHHGLLPPLMRKKTFKNMVKTILLKYSYKKVDSITYQNYIAKDFLSSVPVKHMIFWPVGCDFEQFKPTDKMQARQALGLDENTIYGLFIGPYSSCKGIDLILDAYSKLKSKYNFKILFVGGEPDYYSNELYDQVMETDCPKYGFVSKEKIKTLCNASDFYVHPIFDYRRVAFDVAPVEVMACDRPVLSSVLRELDSDIAKQVGCLIPTPEEFTDKLEYMINHFQTYTKVREVAKQHLDSTTVQSDKLYKIYQQIFGSKS